MRGARATYARDRGALMLIGELMAEEKRRDERSPTPIPPGHCPQCSLEYHFARLLTGRREVSDLCSMCEEEGR